MVLAGWQSPGAKRQTQEGVAGWPDFDPDFAEEPGLVEPYLSAILLEAVLQARAGEHASRKLSVLGSRELLTFNFQLSTSAYRLPAAINYQLTTINS